MYGIGQEIMATFYLLSSNGIQILILKNEMRN